MQQVKAKKALGQHFLTDLSVAQRIADTVSEYKGSPVLEVGPGMGVLTQFLLQAGHDLTVVELDTESVDYLNAVYPDELRDRVQKLTSAIYDILGASGIIRVDYIITEREKINLLEVNTTPGMTATSFIPQQVRAANLDIKDVMTDIIENQF